MTAAAYGVSLGRVTSLLLASRALGYLLLLVNSVILARGLGVERLGEYAYAMGIAALFGLVPNWGISTVVARTIAREPETGAGLVRTALLAQALLATAVLVAIPVFAAVLPEQPVPLAYIGLAAAQLALGTLSLPYLAVMHGRARYDRVAVAELASGLIATLALCGAALLYGGVASFLWAHVLAAGFAVLVARWAASPLLPKGEIDTLRLGTLFREATPFGATIAVQSFYRRLDILLLGQMSSRVNLGLYNVAFKPISAVLNVGNTVAGVLFPVMVSSAQSGVPASFDRAVRGLGVAAPAVALAFSGLADPLLRGLYGAEFSAAAPLLVVLAWSAAANWLYAPLGVALQARGRERLWLSCLLGALALNAAANLWAIPRWGALGAAAATLTSELVLLGLGVTMVWRELGIRPSFRPVCIGLLAVSIGGASLWLLQDFGPFLSTLGALVLYGGLLALFRIVTADDAALVMGWVRQAATVSLRA